MTSCLALTFHGLENQEQKGCLPFDPVARPYTISSELFGTAVEMVSSRPNCTAAEFLEKEEGDWTVITFDDGFISDYDIAFPLLAQQGLTATFFVTTTKIGTPGYVSPSQLQEMAEAGMEIGSHGMSHSYLIDMEPGQVQEEIAHSRQRLEQIIGKEVTSFAPVGGHYSKEVLAMARQAGYRCFASMIPGVTTLNEEYVILRRNHLQAHHDGRYLSRLVSRKRALLFKNFLRYKLLLTAKRILGMGRYDQLKSLFVEGGG